LEVAPHVLQPVQQAAHAYQRDVLSPDEAEAAQQAYHERRRAWAAEIGFPFPERRSRKRKPIPGVIDVVDETEG
jgi:hypothetical protein